jgi:mRNA interferase RelE/StbE
MEITLKKSAIKDLKQIDIAWQEKILDFIENIGNQEVQKAVKLKGIAKDLYRIRLNDYRIIFDYEDETKIAILRILHRKSAYNNVNDL